jgi:23S rRNA (cytosine1962-C5)-methyltransferase
MHPTPLPQPLRDPLADRVLFESDSVVVFDKPSGLAVDAPERPDDLARMVRRRRGASASGAYVGIVHRLERDVSGPCVFTVDRAANARVTAPLEKRSARRTIVAAVRKGPSESALARTFGAPVETVAKGPLGALIEFDPKSEKLSALYERANSILLAPMHLAALEVQVTQERSALFRAEIPAALFESIDPKSAFVLDRATLVRRLRAGLWRRARVLADEDTDLCRLVNEGGDALSGLAVDRYADRVVAHVYESAASLDQSTQNQLWSAIADAFGARAVYAKFRPKQANTLIETRRDDVAPSRPVWGEDDAQGRLVVREHGVRYVTRLGDGLSTGIFLDQRDNRAWVHERARGRSLLNLFAYTGAFSVAAAVGGAARSLSVDASRSAIAWLKEHLAENESAISDRLAHEGACVEVFGWLEGAKARGDRFDMIVCDPPSYSFAKDGPRWSSERDWPELAARVLELSAKGGLALFCSNHRGISPAKLESMLRDGAARAKVTLADVSHVSVNDDFAPAPGAFAHLKSLRVTLR